MLKELNIALRSIICVSRSRWPKSAESIEGAIILFMAKSLSYFAAKVAIFHGFPSSRRGIVTAEFQAAPLPGALQRRPGVSRPIFLRIAAAFHVVSRSASAMPHSTVGAIPAGRYPSCIDASAGR